MYQEYRRENFLVSTDPSKLDTDAIHDFLSKQSYWSQDIPKEIVAWAVQHSLCFGVYHNDRQIGLARVISDYATYAYLCDVYILEQYQGRGLGKWLMSCVMGHPDLQGLRKFALATRDAHELYRKFGFAPLKDPSMNMEISDWDIYKKHSQG